MFDKPTSAVDAESARLIHASVDRFQKGKTCLVIIHQFIRMADFGQAIVLREGETVETGRHRALFSQNGYYAKLYRLQHV